MVSGGGFVSDLTAGGGDGELAGGVSMTAGRDSGFGDGGILSGELTLVRTGDQGSVAADVDERVRLRGPCGVMLGRRRWAREGSSKSSAILWITSSQWLSGLHALATSASTPGDTQLPPLPLLPGLLAMHQKKQAPAPAPRVSQASSSCSRRCMEVC